MILGNMELIKTGICVLISIIALLLIMRVFNVRSLITGKGITNSLRNIEKARSRDYFVLSSNRALMNLAKWVQSGIFKLNRSKEEYLAYNLKRANVKAPGGTRIIEPKEWNALVVVCTGFCVTVGVLITLFINYMIGFVIIATSFACGSLLPMQFLRAAVKAKDAEIENNFTDLYLMLHYVLMEGAKTSLDKIMRTFGKTTNSEELKRFIDISAEYMETYGEYEATKYIMNDYREVECVCELMKLIKQLYDKADIRNDLLAFRTRVVDKKELLLNKRVDILIARARRSFVILMIILVQAVVSAMAIYIPDMGGASMFF